jgi:hypothetical protein
VVCIFDISSEEKEVIFPLPFSYHLLHDLRKRRTVFGQKFSRQAMP